MNRILSMLAFAALAVPSGAAFAQYAPGDQYVPDRYATDDSRAQSTETGPFAGEPTVEEAIEAATRRFRVRVSDMDRYRRRVGVSALLPQVDVSYRMNDSTLDLDHFDALNFPGDDPASVDDGSASVSEIQINAGWDLSRVVFNPLVLDVNAMAGLHDEIAEEVINVYYLRQRLVLSMVNNPPADAGTRQTMELRIAQATATLNALTGGLFE